MTSSVSKTGWITGRRFDLAWYIAPGLVAYLLLYLNLALAVPVMVLWWAWVVLIDGPHVFGTLSRTYCDAEEWRQRRGLFLGALLWFLPGPIAVALGVWAGSRQPYLLFLVFANLWAYWHVVRQHYGFMCLYQRVRGEPAGRDNAFDYWLYYTAILAPLGCFILVNAQAREAMLLSAAPGAGDLIALRLLQGLVCGATALYLARQWWLWQHGRAVNGVKNLFLLSCVPLHWTVCMVPAVAERLDLLMFSVAVTFHHNIQYHGIVWYFNRNRYHRDDARARHGWLATAVSRNFLTYYAAGLLFTFLVRYSSWFFTGMEDIPGGPGPNAVSATALGSGYTVSELAVAFWWGFAFHHYYLDQKIWRVSRDRGVRDGLRVA